MPTFSFPDAPEYLPVILRRRPECSPTADSNESAPVFGAMLDARSSSTRHRSTSELLRTL